MVMPAPRSSASKSSATPEASSMEAATLNPRASVMLTTGDGRLSEPDAVMSKPEGTMRQPTASTLVLYGSLVTAPSSVAFDPGVDSAGERTKMAEPAAMRLPTPRSKGARLVVWKSVVTSLPDAGTRARSEWERYSRRTW
uniref:Uncharacterized protein n=1 Tax=Triticum urartu TaxID=4572 RepID=A0A8R7U2Z4_TRIUA